MEVIITNRQFGKEWHVGTDVPQANCSVYAIVELDSQIESDPQLVEATVEWVENHNPPLIWKLELEDGTIDTWSISGGHSVYFWRYKYGDN
jgi:hypothetical protein